MRPPTLPSAESFPHGTRSRYVCGCRCRKCKDANVRRYHRRFAESVAAASSLPPPTPAPSPQTWTAPDGSKRTRVYTRACPGINNKPCPTHSHLRKDSGPVCSLCRDRLLWDGIVPAKPAKLHMAKLSRQGCGRRAVGAVSNVADSILTKIKNGKKQMIRKSTLDRIMAVNIIDARGERSLVDSTQTYRLIDWLLSEGTTPKRLHRRLKLKKGSQLLTVRRAKITARTALRVQKYFLSLFEGDDEGPPRKVFSIRQRV